MTALKRPIRLGGQEERIVETCEEHAAFIRAKRWHFNWDTRCACQQPFGDSRSGSDGQRHTSAEACIDLGEMEHVAVVETLNSYRTFGSKSLGDSAARIDDSRVDARDALHHFARARLNALA